MDECIILNDAIEDLIQLGQLKSYIQTDRNKRRSHEDLASKHLAKYRHLSNNQSERSQPQNNAPKGTIDIISCGMVKEENSPQSKKEIAQSIMQLDYTRKRS